MKTLGFKGLIGMALLLTGCMASFGQASQAEVPGDNFSLEGALELFKKSSSPEEFEKMLNTPDTKVNNLDLNGDGYIDYVRVVDLHEGNIHTFIIQAVLAEDEFQDIAVIALEKLANGKAVLQITGDEDIYGVTTIIEPTKEVRTYAGTYASSTVVNVWAWPVVQYVYSPYYTVWVSPWRWYYRPVWWSPWRPIAYYDYYPIWRPYYHYYAVCHTPRVYVHHIYHPHRRTSVIVHRRYNTQIVHYRENYDRNGRTRDDRRYLNSTSGGRQNTAGTNGRQRLDTDNVRSLNRESLNRTNAVRRGSSLSSPSRSATRTTTRELPERNSSSDNDYTLRQPVRRPSSTEGTRSGSNLQRPDSRSVERRSSTPMQQRSTLPSRDDASRMRSLNDNSNQRQLSTPSYNERRSSGSGEVQRSRSTIQRSAPVQQERAPAQVQRAPAVRSAPSNSGGQRQQVSPPPSRERSGSSGSPTIQRPGNSDNTQGTNGRGRR